MKKLRIIIIGLIFCCNINAQTDSVQYVVKFNIDINTLVKGDGFSINYFGFEKAISKSSSLLFGIGYDLHSSNLIINNQESVVSNQTFTIKLDYRYYLFNMRNMQGFYIFPSIAYNLDIESEGNQKNNQIGFYLGLGYQKMWKRIVFDVLIDKGYVYSRFKNDEIKFITSQVSPFNITFSVGLNF
ncbi:hypothetical protein FACS189451_03550 [Bacteroidia bacterium]|nr:hypothetical protein FACS189451_03550 [Bacteroidia bacterium]